MKSRTIMALGAALAVGGALLFGRKASAATSSLVVVDGKLGAVATGAQIVSGGTWVVVACDATYWSEMRGVLEARARASTGTRWVLADMEMLREEAEDRGVSVPTSAWGGVAYIEDGELKNYSYFYGSIVEAVAQIGTPGGLQSSGSDVGFMAGFGVE